MVIGEKIVFALNAQESWAKQTTKTTVIQSDTVNIHSSRIEIHDMNTNIYHSKSH